MTVFGRVIDGSDVETALLEHLQAWMPTTIAEIVRQKDPGGTRWPAGVAPIRSYTVTHAANEKWPEDQLPMLLAFCPGFADEPSYEGEGKLRARFVVNLAAICSSVTLADTKDLSRLYADAAALAIVQHESLSGFAEGVAWVGSTNFPISRGVEAERNLMAVENLFVVEVADVLDRNAGIAEPLADPSKAPADWPSVKAGGGDVDVILGAHLRIPLAAVYAIE